MVQPFYNKYINLLKRAELVIFKCNQQSFLSHSLQVPLSIKLKKKQLIFSTAMKTLLQQKQKIQKMNTRE
jgi:hypothetical protein